MFFATCIPEKLKGKVNEEKYSAYIFVERRFIADQSYARYESSTNADLAEMETITIRKQESGLLGHFKWKLMSLSMN